MPILYKSVPIPSDLLEALGDDAGLWWSSPEIEPIIHEAIRAWLKSPGTAKPQQQLTAAETGYQWKQLFLPEETARMFGESTA